MNNHITTIEAALNLTSESAEAVNRVAGHVFDNGSVEIDFHGVQIDVQPSKNRFKFNLSHQGIEAQGWITSETVQRLLEIDIRHLEPEYISYCLARKASKYGVSSFRYEEDVASTSQPYIRASFFLGEMSVEGTLNVSTLYVDGTFLRVKKKVLSDQLKLSVSWAPFETTLTAEELSALTSQDLVLVFPK